MPHHNPTILCTVISTVIEAVLISECWLFVVVYVLCILRIFGMHILSEVVSLVVRTKAIDCLEGLVSEMTYYASSAMLNAIHSFN